MKWPKPDKHKKFSPRRLNIDQSRTITPESERHKYRHAERESLWGRYRRRPLRGNRLPTNPPTSRFENTPWLRNSGNDHHSHRPSHHPIQPSYLHRHSSPLWPAPHCPFPSDPSRPKSWQTHNARQTSWPSRARILGSTRSYRVDLARKIPPLCTPQPFAMPSPSLLSWFPTSWMQQHWPFHWLSGRSRLPSPAPRNSKRDFGFNVSGDPLKFRTWRWIELNRKDQCERRSNTRACYWLNQQRLIRLKSVSNPGSIQNHYKKMPRMKNSITIG